MSTPKMCSWASQIVIFLMKGKYINVCTNINVYQNISNIL